MEEYRHRTRVMNGVKSSGTSVFNFFKQRCSTDSWSIIEGHATFAAAYAAAPKNGFQIYRTIIMTHSLGGNGGIRMSSQEINRVDDTFNAINQGGLELCWNN